MLSNPTDTNDPECTPYAVTSVPLEIDSLHVRLLLTQLYIERLVIAPFSRGLKFSWGLLNARIRSIEYWLHVHGHVERR